MIHDSKNDIFVFVPLPLLSTLAVWRTITFLWVFTTAAFIGDTNKTCWRCGSFQSERNGHSTSYLQYVQRCGTSRGNIGKTFQHNKFIRALGEILWRSMSSSGNAARRKKRKEKQTPKRMVKQTTSDSARPCSLKSEKARGVPQGSFWSWLCCLTCRVILCRAQVCSHMITDILATGRRIIGHFKRSPQAYCAFHVSCFEAAFYLH